MHRSELDAHETDTVLWRLRAQGRGPLWPVHRLDKGTSGVLVLARDAAAARSMGAAFETGHVCKRYQALVRGWPAAAGRIDRPLAHDPERPSQGQIHRPALTVFECLARYEWPLQVDPRHPTARYALLALRPETGRRHQLRRHLKHLGHPIIGDATHGKGVHNRAVARWLDVSRLWLHALAITLPHPDDGRALTVDSVPGPQWARLDAFGRASL